MAHYEEDDRIIERVRIVVHTTGSWPNGMSDNHWSLYLLLKNESGSVRMNMTAAFDDPTGTLEWTSPSYKLTRSSVNYWDYDFVFNVSVKTVYKMILDKNRHQYTMSGGGSGCRWWVYVIITDFEENKYFTRTNVGQDLYPKLLFRYSSKVPPKSLPMIKGHFTGPPTTLSSTTPPVASSMASSSFMSFASPAPVTVQVKNYYADGQLCYSWTLNGVDDRSYANEWTSSTSGDGIKGILHRTKNLFSTIP